ncbi:glycosyltransferase family 4 protein [Marinobacter halotolerans]|uniref:glycosyltransferase family 4 protein n=1 Tax=Marinobacter halotolerans TaxID=1569211 RepID=UPI0012467CFA|nr:glycosyltransferase family 4 protein [Marinobacter halotolerans]
MRILIATSSAPFGRGESFVIAEANEMARSGNDVSIFPTVVRRGSPNNFRLHDRCRLISARGLTARTILVFLKYVLFRPFLTLRILRGVISKSRTNTLKNWVIVPRAFWLADYISANTVDHIHAHWLTTPATLAMIVSDITGIGWSASAHRGDIVAGNLLAEKFEKATFIRFISESGKGLAKERAPLDSGKARVLHLGVGVPSAETRSLKADRKENEGLKILCPANLVPVKGHEFLFRSLARLRAQSGFEVIIAGEGELKDSLQSMAAELGINHFVRFAGHVPHDTLLRWYADSEIDIVVLPSQDLGGGVHEGIPVSLMEAMSFRIPVISTNTGGIPELLVGEQGEAFGGMVDPQDVGALAELLDELIESPEQRFRLGQKGFERVAVAFNREESVASLIKLIQLQDRCAL